MESPIAVAMRRLLNDRAVFPFCYDQESHRNIGLFDREEWSSLKNAYQAKDFDALRSKVQSRKIDLERERGQVLSRRRGRSQDRNPYEVNIKLADSMVAALESSPAILDKLFDIFDAFGALETHLPKMEDFGKVAEFEPPPILQQYFLSKIDRADNDRQRLALKRVLEQVEYLLAQGSEPAHIGFFLRKLESLKLLPEVITNA